MSISSRSAYQQATYQQAHIRFRDFMENADLDALLNQMPVKQNYIKTNEIESIAESLLDVVTNEKYCDIINDTFAKGTSPEIIHEEVYSKPISGNLIDFNDPALKKLTGMLPIKGIEKKIVGDIERKNLKSDLGTHVKSASLGNAEAYITNVEKKMYHFVSEDGQISSLFFGSPPQATHLMDDNQYQNTKIMLMTRIYKLVRIAYDSLLIGSTDIAVKAWHDIGSEYVLQKYVNTVTAQRAIADALRYQIKLIYEKNNKNIETAFSIAERFIKNSFNMKEFKLISSFISAAIQSMINDPASVDKIKHIFTEDFNNPTPAIVYQHVDEKDIQKLVYMFKRYIELLKS